jgi:hypothetical protein
MSWDFVWQAVMAVIGITNLCIAVFLFSRSKKWAAAEPQHAKYFSFLRTAGLIYVSVALYRIIFVSSYPDRLVWFDTILNSPFIIRCLAAFAEMCFIGMIAVILYKMCRDAVPAFGAEGRPFGAMLMKLPFIAVGCIFAAQFFAFAGLITQYLTPFAIEETLWAVAFLCILPVVITGLRNVKKAEKGLRTFLVLMAVWCFGYLLFQCFYALPFMYYAELAQDIGKTIPADALMKAVSGSTATRDFDAWGGIGFFIWHSGYFSVCAWMTLFFMTAPRRTV